MKSLPAYIESMKDVDDIVVLDGGSTDGTREFLSKQSNCRVFDQDPHYLDANGYIIDFSAVRNQGYALAKHPWILCIDADETASHALLEQVRSVVESGKTGVYYVNRLFTLHGKPVVGLGAFGQSVFVGTTGNPYVIQGSDPGSLTMTKLPQKQACVSKRSIVEMNGGVIYASPDGLMQVTESNGLSSLTAGLINRDDWQSFNPSSFSSFELDSRYYAFYDNGTTQGCLVFDFGAKPNFHKLDIYATAGYNERRKDALFLAIGNVIKKWDYGTTNLTMTWHSKRYRFSSQINMGVAKIDAASYPVTFKLWADGALKITKTVANNQIFKLPSGYRAEKFELEVSASDQIISVAVGETAKDIRQVYV